MRGFVTMDSDERPKLRACRAAGSDRAMICIEDEIGRVDLQWFVECDIATVSRAVDAFNRVIAEAATPMQQAAE